MSHPKPTDEAHEARAVALAAARRGEGTYHKKWAKKKHWLDLTVDRSTELAIEPADPAELAAEGSPLFEPIAFDDRDDVVAQVMRELDEAREVAHELCGIPPDFVFPPEPVVPSGLGAVRARARIALDEHYAKLGREMDERIWEPYLTPSLIGWARRQWRRIRAWWKAGQL